MPKVRKSSLPLPRSWLPRRVVVEDKVAAGRDYMLGGRAPAPGTKLYLQYLLLQQGWDYDDVQAVLRQSYHARDRLRDVAAEERALVNDQDILALVETLKAEVDVTPMPKVTKGATRWSQDVWDSYTRYPWWTAAAYGSRVLILVHKSTSTLQRASASFVHDLWANLNERPMARMPVVRRFNLLTWASTSGLIQFKKHMADQTDLAVVYGALLDKDHLYQSLGYINAMASVFPGVLLIEALSQEDVGLPLLLRSAQRAGFSLIFELGAQ